MADPNTSNHILPAALYVLGLIAAGLTAYALHAEEASSQPAKSNEEQKPVIKTASAAIPPIDREVPAKIETATFAMG